MAEFLLAGCSAILPKVSANRACAGSLKARLLPMLSRNSASAASVGFRIPPAKRCSVIPAGEERREQGNA